MPVIPKAISALKAERLEVSRIAVGAVLQFSPVRLVTKDSVEVANVDTLAKATVYGVALTTVANGESVSILLMGNLEDPSFAFGLNVGLFQSALGPISAQSTTIVGEFYCRIGKSNGAGSIFVQPEVPVEVF